MILVDELGIRRAEVTPVAKALNFVLPNYRKSVDDDMSALIARDDMFIQSIIVAMSRRCISV